MVGVVLVAMLPSRFSDVEVTSYPEGIAETAAAQSKSVVRYLRACISSLYWQQAPTELVYTMRT